MKHLIAGCVAAVLSAGSAVASTIDVMFLLDGSGSLESVGFDAEKTFATNAITNFVMPSPTGNRVAASVFASGVTEIFDFDDAQATDASSAVASISNTPWPTGLTWTKTALETAISVFDTQSSDGREKIIFLLTDGNPRPSRTESVCSSASSTKNELDNAGITVFIVGAGANWNPQLVSCLVDDPSSQIAQIDDFTAGDLEDIFPTALTPTVPVPASLPMVLAGLGAFAIVRRRRRAA